MKKPIIVGNWKLNGNKKILSNFFNSLNMYLPKILKYCTIVIAPPTIYIDHVQKLIKKKQILLGSQHVDINYSGAFTGETSIYMLKECDVKYVIVGHSEQRKYHNNTDQIIAKKFKIIKEANLIPILCIGETLEEKTLGKTYEICIKQLNHILDIYDGNQDTFNNSIIAYEPIWAIGSGKPASAYEAQKIHEFIKSYIDKNNILHDCHQNLSFLYGGSVNANNVCSFLKEPDIDGVLLGFASIQLRSFLDIIQLAVKQYSYEDDISDK